MNKLIALFFALCSSGSFAMNVSILIKNITADQIFEIRTVSDTSGTTTLYESTKVSDVWYGGTPIRDATKIAPGQTKRLFISTDKISHSSRSDYFRLKNHSGEFYVHFGRTTQNIPYPLPVVTLDNTDVEAKNVPMQGIELGSSSGVYKAVHINRRSEGGDVISLQIAR